MPEKGTRRRVDAPTEEPTETEQTIFDETMVFVKEATSGDEHRQARLSIQQDDIINSYGGNLLLKLKAEDWLKLPSGWPKMSFTIEDLMHDNGFIIEAVNIGADAGVAHRRSGFMISANEIKNIGINVQVFYLPEDVHYREPVYNMQNSYWRRQKAFMETLNARGTKFVDYLKQLPEIDVLRFAKSLIEQAINPQKSAR